MRKEVLIASILILTLLGVGTILPAGFYVTNLLNPQSVMVESDNVTETIFANFTSVDEPSILPHPVRVLSENPFIIEENYSHLVDQISVTYEDALDTALSMLNDVGPSFIRWNLLVASNITSPPSWKFRFSFPSFSAYVIVETITGRVIEFEINYLHDFEPTPLTLDQAENFTIHFLGVHNYTIPENARYIEGFPYDCQRFFSLVFQEYVGPIEVEDSRIIVRASAFTKGISYFQYHWFGLDSIDTSSIIGPELVKLNLQSRLQQADAVVLKLENSTDVTWEAPELKLARIETEDAKIHRLSWLINAEANSTDQFEASFYLDAYTGNLYGFRSSDTPYSEIEEVLTAYSGENLQHLVTFFSLGFGIAVISMVIYGVATRKSL
jgi:hypothetical protein